MKSGGPARAMAPLVKLPMRSMGFDGDTHYGDLDTGWQSENRGEVMRRPAPAIPASRASAGTARGSGTGGVGK